MKYKVFIAPNGVKIRFIHREVKANGYKAVMSWQVDENFFDSGSIWVHDRNGVARMHGLITKPLSYSELRTSTKNFGKYLARFRRQDNDEN